MSFRISNFRAIDSMVVEYALLKSTCFQQFWCGLGGRYAGVVVEAGNRLASAGRTELHNTNWETYHELVQRKRFVT